MTTFADQPLEDQIAQWREHLRQRQAFHSSDIEELEGHLRDQLTALIEAGLAGEEAFLVAVKRMGNLDALSREFARAHSERLWKQLVIGDVADESTHIGHSEMLVVLGLALAAAVAIKVPALFGLQIDGSHQPFYLRNAGLFVLPLLTVYFIWKRGRGLASALWLALPFTAGAVFANIFPFSTNKSHAVREVDEQNEVLAKSCHSVKFALRASPGLVCRAGAMADRLSPRVRRVGGDRRHRVSAGIPIEVTGCIAIAAGSTAPDTRLSHTASSLLLSGARGSLTPSAGVATLPQQLKDRNRGGRMPTNRSSAHNSPSSLALLLTAIALCGVARLSAQSVGANVGGVVTDPTGARLPGVTVTITNKANGATQAFVTGPEGNYRAVALRPGPYAISAELQGFAPQNRAVTLTVGEDTVVNLMLSLATVQESVTVTGTAPISVAKAELASVVLPSQVESLPTLGRNFLELAQLLPGSAPDNSRTQYFNPTKFAGVADQRNGFTTVIDGGAVDDAIWGSTVMNFTQEAVQEFKVYRNQFDAEYGGALAAVVSVVSKSGSNRLGGSAIYFGRDDALNSQDFFTSTKPPFSQKRAGGSLGGPILMSRTHFFGAYEYNGIDTVNVIALPAANPFAANQNGVFPANNIDHMADGRVDHRFNDHHSVYARFAYDNLSKLRTQAVSSDSNQIDEYSKSNSFVANENWIVSQSILNAFHFTFLQQDVGNTPHSFDLNVARPSAVVGQSTISPQYFPRHTTTLYDTLYYNTPSHNIKIGGSLAFAMTSFESHFFEHASYTFTTDAPFNVNNSATWPLSFTIRLPGKFTYNSKQIALFVQDDWHVADRVRLNLGARYDLDTNLRANDFYTTILDNPAYAGLKNFISVPRGTDYKNLQPRLGATWDVRGNGTLVARGAGGIYSTRNRPWFQVNSMSSLLGNNVQIFDPQLLKNYPNIDATLGGKSIQDYIAAGGTRSVFLVGDDSVLPYSVNASGGFGWQVNPRSSLDVDYVHNFGTKQLGGRDMNLPPSGPISATNPRPVTGYSTVTVMQNFSNSWYDALEAQFRTHVNHVDNVLISYTFARSFRDGVDFFGTPRGTQRTPNEVGYTETDQRHTLAISAATTLPWLIQISGIGKFVSGSPFHDQAGVDLDGDGTVTNDRPAGLDSSVGRRDVDSHLQIINTFRASRGLAPVPASLLRLDPFVSVDARITKAFPLGASRRVDLFFEGFNLTNHENFTPYSVNVNLISSSFLVRNGARPPRQFQWGARYAF